MRGHLKFVYEAPNQTVANRIALNWTMHIQTMVYVTLYVRSALFWDITQHYNNISGQHTSTSFKGQEIQKTEQSKTSVN